jgi:hypothetical protein
LRREYRVVRQTVILAGRESTRLVSRVLLPRKEVLLQGRKEELFREERGRIKRQS